MSARNFVCKLRFVFNSRESRVYKRYADKISYVNKVFTRISFHICVYSEPTSQPCVTLIYRVKTRKFITETASITPFNYWAIFPASWSSVGRASEGIFTGRRAPSCRLTRGAPRSIPQGFPAAPASTVTPHPHAQTEGLAWAARRGRLDVAKVLGCAYSHRAASRESFCHVLSACLATRARLAGRGVALA